MDNDIVNTENVMECVNVESNLCDEEKMVEVNDKNETNNDTPTEDCVIVEEEVNSSKVGKYVGQCKWFNDLLGYGFVTVCDGDDKGKDIFVHHSGIMPLNSNYRTLKKGEYLNFDIVDGMNGLQAVHVTGINGGPLMCDFVSSVKPIQQDNTPSNGVQRNVVKGLSQKPFSYQRGVHMSRVQQNPVSQPLQSSTKNNGEVMSSSYKGKANGNVQLGSQWYVVTKTGRKKNLAKYSKEGRMLMKQVKQQES